MLSLAAPIVWNRKAYHEGNEEPHPERNHPHVLFRVVGDRGEYSNVKVPVPAHSSLKHYVHPFHFAAFLALWVFVIARTQGFEFVNDYELGYGLLVIAR